MSEITYNNKTVSLNISPLTVYQLAKAGFSLVEDLQDPVRQPLFAAELLRICSGTQETAEEVAANLDSFEPLFQGIMDLISEEEEKQPKEGTPEGNE